MNLWYNIAQLGGKMKYFYYKNMPSYISRFDFITGYDIKDDKIIVNYASGYSTEKENTKENLRSIVEAMKNQVFSTIDGINMEKINKSIKSDNFWIGYNSWFTIYTLYNSLTSTSTFNKGFQGVLCCLFILLGFQRLHDRTINKEKKNEILKYKYFLDNEDIINYEILKRYFDEEPNSPDLSDVPLITINDIDNMSLTELKETVELIRQNYGEELESNLLELKQKSTI